MDGSEWCHATGAQVQQADFQHVVCGMCACVDEEERETGRKALRNGASAVLRELLRQGRRGVEEGVRGWERLGGEQWSWSRQRSAHLPKVGVSATMREQEGLRRLIAGDLPDVDAGTAGKKAAKCVAVSVPGARLAYGENNRKLMGPFTEASRQAGRRVKLSTLLQLNGVQGKLGAGADAPGLWRAGRQEQLQRYCMRDVIALAEVVTKPWVRVPGGGGTDRMCVATRRQDSDDGDAVRPPPAATGSAGKRPRQQMGYDETQRRVRRRPSEKVRHVARSRHAAAERGTLKRTIEVGPLTVERVVRGRYEWWDAGLQPLFHTARRRMWEGARTWDPGIW